MKFELVNQLLVSFNKCALVTGWFSCWFFISELQLCSVCGLFASAVLRVRVWLFEPCPVTLIAETVSSVCCNWDPSEIEKIQSVSRIYSYWWCVFSWHQDQGFTLQVPWLRSLGIGSAEGRCLPGERVALLGAHPDPWVCHLKALRSKMSDDQVKCREPFFTYKWHCAQGAKTFLKFMLGTAWWKCRYVFITGGALMTMFFYFLRVHFSSGDQQGRAALNIFKLLVFRRETLNLCVLPFCWECFHAIKSR